MGTLSATNLGTVGAGLVPALPTMPNSPTGVIISGGNVDLKQANQLLSLFDLYIW
jgi:hypothetical protein